MDEIFLEQIVSKKSTYKTVIGKILIALGAAALILAMSYIDYLSMFLPFLALGIIAITILLVRRMNIEYEYLLSGNELDIDIIYAKSSRKHLITIQLNSVSKFAPVSDTRDFSAWKEKSAKIKDYSSSETAPGRYFAVFEGEYGKTLVILEPDTRLSDAITKALPRGII
ncbi:MAG: hypothetical protein GX541_05340 [Clostridiales bacterium]|jgi:hypothetical protein|nr:hypothetical protein [Clostridiales bacterium]